MHRDRIRWFVPTSRRLELARAVTADLRRQEGRNLVAVGVYGSVARGEERRHSDVDLLVVVRRKRRPVLHEVREGIVLTVLQQTPDEAKAEVTGSRADINAALGGWTSIRALHDPTGLLRRLRTTARHPTVRQFQEASRWALVEAYEDVGKLWNAVEADDIDEAREMSIWFSTVAAGAVFNLHRHVLKTGRRAFVEVRRYGRLGTAICRLRYEPLSLSQMRRLSEFVWGALLDRATAEGIRLPRFARHARDIL